MREPTATVVGTITHSNTKTGTIKCLWVYGLNAMHGRNHSRQESHRELTTAEKIERDPTMVRSARHHFAELDFTHSPNLRKARVLQAAGLPEWCGSRKVLRIGIANGRPEHGEMRSDDHISHFEAEAPLEEIDEAPDYCPECAENGPDVAGWRGLYRYRANHYIAGSETVFCTSCEEVLHSEEWG